MGGREAAAVLLQQVDSDAKWRRKAAGLTGAEEPFTEEEVAQLFDETKAALQSKVDADELTAQLEPALDRRLNGGADAFAIPRVGGQVDYAHDRRLGGGKAELLGKVERAHLGVEVGGVFRGDGGQVGQAQHHGFADAPGLASSASSLACHSGMLGSSVARRE